MREASGGQLLTVKGALFCWMAALFIVHARDLALLFPISPALFAAGLWRELSPGPYLLRFWPPHLLRSAACLAFFAGLWALGDVLLERLLKPREPAPLRLPFSLGIGLGAWIYATFSLAVLGLIPRGLLFVLFAGACLVGVGALWSRARRWNPRRFWREASRIERIGLVGLSGCLGVAYIGTTIPEISYDALVYHLALPQDYLDAGKMIETPHNHFMRLPLNSSMLYLWGLVVDGVHAAKLLNFGVGAALLLALYGAGEALSDRRLGLYACLVFVSTPVVLYLFWMTNSDLLSAFFAFLSLLSLWEWSRGGRAHPGFFYLSGLFGGLALATKYTAAFSLAAQLSFCAWSWARKRSPRTRQLAVYVALMILPLLPWWGRNYAFTGNPFSPYLAGVFHEKDADVELLANWRGETRDGSPGLNLGRHVQKTWQDAAKGARDLPYTFVGPLFLGACFFALTAWRLPWMRWGTFFVGAAYLLGLSGTYITRLLIACFAPASLIVAQALRAAGSPPIFRRALIALAGAIMAANVLAFARLMFLSDIEGLSVASGKASPAAYLKRARNLYPNPSFGAYEHIAALGLGPDERVLVAGEARSFYSPGVTLGNAPYNAPLLLAWASRSPSPEQLWETLRARGVSVILDNFRERSRVDAAQYVNARDLALVTSVLRAHFVRTYADAWTSVYRVKPESR